MRSYLGWYRHITLVMLAHAFLAAICATTPDSQAAPAGESFLGTLLPLTIPEVRHLLGLLIWPAPANMKRALAWSWWRRCHQHRASSFHRKRRLKAG